MGNEGFWSRTRRIALEVVTTGGTRKFDVLRQEAQEADERLRAACREYEQLEVRMKFLAVSRGAANQLAHLRLVEVTEVVQKFGNARAVQVLTLSDQSCPAIAKMQKTIVDFNVAVELITGSGAGIATTAGAWAAVSGLGVASTGTAISGLSGAAATHATLAWFGGGSLVTGGGGMALGSCVIGRVSYGAHDRRGCVADPQGLPTKNGRKFSRKLNSQNPKLPASIRSCA